jgi:hypothetical protein
MTPGTLCLTVRAAVRISAQFLGCQSAGRPAFAKIALLNQRPRVSVPSGMPYVLPSYALAAAFAVSTNWLHWSHLGR